MASMSDIAFLLIIFFITSMSFLYRQGIKVQLPIKDSPPAVVSLNSILMIKIDRAGNYYENDRKIQLAGIIAKDKSAAIVKVDKACQYKYLVALLEYLQEKDITKISIKRI
jgi:biopolymer transport protein ExbD